MPLKFNQTGPQSPTSPESPPQPSTSVSKPAKGKKVVSRKLNHEALRRRYIRENMQPNRAKEYTIFEMADDMGIPVKTLLDMGQRYGWKEQLAALKEESAYQFGRQLIADVLISEREIRERQAKVARAMVDKAYLALMSLNPEDIPIKEAINMLRVGLTEERRALGMVEKVTEERKEDTTPNQLQTVLGEVMGAITQRRHSRSPVRLVSSNDAETVEPHDVPR